MPERAFHELGDLLTKALLSRDFDLYESCMALPVKFTPQGGKPYILQDEAALREDFELYVSIIRLHGVTDIYRRLVGHDPEGEDIWLRCTTYILVRANLLTEPFPSRWRLRRGAGGWRIAEIETSKGHLNWTLGLAEVSPDGKFEMKQQGERDAEA